MNLQDLLAQYARDRRIEKLASILTEASPGVIHLQGLAGSASAFVARALTEIHQAPYLFILPDKESAAYFQNDLKGLYGKKEILFLPDSYHKPGHLTRQDNN